MYCDVTEAGEYCGDVGEYCDVDAIDWSFELSDGDNGEYRGDLAE